MNNYFILIYTFIFLFSLTSDALESYKDSMFSNKDRSIIEQKNKGSFRRYRWDEIEDVNGRDEIPGVAAKPERLDQEASKTQKSIKIKYRDGEIDTYEVGHSKGAKFAAIFIHGANGNKDLGVSDVSFGGNFNRLKSLVNRNNGVYYSPSVELPTSKEQDMFELVKYIRRNSSDVKIVFICGSAGARVCWSVAHHDETAKNLAGLIFVGGARDDYTYQSSRAYKERVPLIFSHGSKDKLVPVATYVDQYEAILKSDPNYPVRMEIFEGGKHGTPMRNIDYKESLEWIFLNEPNSMPADQVSGATSLKMKTSN